ncbi:MAG: HAD family hydrolase [Lachnospiraceae bacterium]|nr:HAD family hydrolase [Lachnospiraceae bacterium]MDD7148348.1 HAD family hydrolase [Lachnospiraceae bacterium]MDY4068655.1 HAD family hydrolase [Lachnospiraceae bacterium]
MRGVIFDLDGTLSDSIISIAYCANRALEKYGLSPFVTDRYKYFVGDGAATLIHRCVENQETDRSDLYEQVKAEYDRLFAVDCMYQVKPYPGIVELLQELKKRQIPIAVLSNKPHPNTLKVIHDLFGDDMFTIVQGQIPQIEKKPSPDGVLYIAEKLGIPAEQFLYVGDTNTDMQTGKNAGAFTVGVLWGFRDRKELEDNDADAIIETPMELLQYLDK